MLLYNAAGTLGLAMRWNLHELPWFTVWKNTAAVEDGYVTGLEPALNFPNFKTVERQRGRVRVLPPGGRWEATWSIEIQDTAAGVSRTLAEIVAVQARVRPIVHRLPEGKFSGP